MSKIVLVVLLFIPVLTVAACREAERARVPSEVNEVITNIGEQIAEERYEQRVVGTLEERRHARAVK